MSALLRKTSRLSKGSLTLRPNMTSSGNLSNTGDRNGTYRPHTIPGSHSSLARMRLTMKKTMKIRITGGGPSNQNRGVDDGQ